MLTNGSFEGDTFNQFILSASPCKSHSNHRVYIWCVTSKGDALACTPFSPTNHIIITSIRFLNEIIVIPFGEEDNPSCCQSDKIFPRRESLGASLGSVGPSTFLFPINKAIYSMTIPSEVRPTQLGWFEFYYIVVNRSTRGDKGWSHRHEEAIEDIYWSLSRNRHLWMPDCG